MATKVALRVDGMTCSDCSSRLEKSLRALDGVSTATVALMAGQASVEFAAGVEGAACAALVARMLALGPPLGFAIEVMASGLQAALRLDIAAAGGRRLDVAAAAAVAASLPGVASAAAMADVAHAGRTAQRAGVGGVEVRYEASLVGARSIVDALRARAGVAASPCAHAGEAASEARLHRRLAGALALAAASIVLQFGVPAGSAAFDAPLAGLLTARVLLQWALATVAAAVFGAPLAMNAYGALVHNCGYHGHARHAEQRRGVFLRALAAAGVVGGRRRGGVWGAAL
jgi:cation transport ATPase